MVRQLSFLRNLDPRSFPIAVKITLGLVVLLGVAFFIGDQIIRQVIGDGQTQLALDDLKDFSRAQGFRIVDILGQESGALNRAGLDPALQSILRSHLTTDTSSATGVVLEAQPYLQQLVVTFREAHAEFDSVIVADAQGHLLAADPTPADLTALSGPTWTWFTQAYRDGAGATFISNPFDDKLTRIQGIHIAVPIYDQLEPKKVIGVVYGIWNMKNAAEVAVTGSGREGLIVERDGTILLSPNPEEQGKVVSARLLTQMNQSMNNSFRLTDDAGKEMLYGNTHLPELGISDTAITGLGWVMLVRRDPVTLVSSVELLQTRLRLVLGIISGAIALMILFFSRLLLVPLRRLTDAAVRIQSGDMSAQIPQFALDEIGRLSNVLSHVVQQLVRRVQNLNSAVEISRKTALTMDISRMLAEVSAVLAQQFGYPDVRIYLAEPTAKRVRLQAAAGGEGERLLRMGHRIDIDERSLVGRAILLNEPALGGTHDKLREAGLVAESNELALPLQSGGQVLGAIEILSHRLQEFTTEEIGILRLISDQISASIQNARLFEQAAANVREIEALNRRLTRQAWEEYVSSSGAIRHTLDPDQDWPKALSEIRLRNEIRAETYLDESGRSVLAAPVILRGEAVGTLAVTRPGGENWTRDEVLLLEAIASRMAIIAEGIRLVDESSQRAEREERVNEISANLLQRATNVETVLRSALGELGGALGSDRIALRIGKLPARDDHQIGTGPLAGRDQPASPDNGSDGTGDSVTQTEPGEDGGEMTA